MLLMLRWSFSGAIAVLAIEYSIANPHMTFDPEKVVPVVISQVLPSGIKGFVLAALLSSALTTFDSTINSASSYWTIDIYKALINPKASDTQLLRQARLSTCIIMAIGLLLSLTINTINRVWGFMTIAMGGGVIWPYFFSWYWSRFNGFGCFVAIFSGVLTSFIVFL